MLFLQARVLYNFQVPSNAEELWYNQTRDHFDTHPKGETTFRQRYYTNFSFIPKDGYETVILYLGGEAELRDRSVQSGSYIDLAQRTNSAIFGLEHRFFGKSMLNTELDLETFKLLTVEQALADIEEFISNVIQNHEQCKNKGSARVVVVGGSYPGAASSWFRLKYPHAAVASWASSAPVNIKNDFSEYDSHIADVLSQYEGCLSNTQSVIQTVQGYIERGETENINKVREDFGFTPTQDLVSIIYVLTDAVSAIVQYADVMGTLPEFCEHQREKPNYDLFKSDVLKGLKMLGADVRTMDILEAVNSSIESDMASTRSWYWMVCNQFGWFQTASGKFRSSWINMSYFSRICDTVYKNGPANTEVVNTIFGGTDPRSNHIYFTYGDVDPWTELGVLDSKQELQRKVGVIKGGSHCSDLDSEEDGDTDSRISVRNDVMDTIEEWLLNSESKCDNKCEHGQCIDGQCRCENGYIGKRCESVATDKLNLDLTIIFAISIPTLAAVAAIFSFWYFGYRPKHMKSET